MRLVLRLRPRLLLGLVLAAAATTPAWAVYKVVGPDGSVTFTNIPPSAPSGSVATVPGIAASPADAGNRLPARLSSLQRTAPVVIYTTPGCKACKDGVRLLQHKGIPYTEKTIVSAQDAAAFKRMDPGMRVPLLRIAGVELPPGFDAAAWEQSLHAAGYPEQSELPKGYRFALPQPLVPQQPAQPPRLPAAAAASVPPAPVLPPPNPHAPPGFRF